MFFSKCLIQWYLQNKRELPWRATKDPYKIWLSEIILQQTRVEQGMSYYFKFIDTFPDVKKLADASEEEVLKLWQGLGYYSRARNLHYSANYIVHNFKGVFPSTYKEIIKLKGVGDYTASAIVSISFNEPHAVVDGNVYRVLARYFGIETPINSTKGIKEFKQLAQELIDVNNPGTHNQAVMEFGARLCKPQNPDCLICPLQSKCVAFAKNKVKELPVKEKKINITKRFFNFMVIHTPDDTTLLEKRTKGIWQNLYQFPLIETKKEVSETEIINSKKFDELFENLEVSLKLYNSTDIVHKLSHQHIHTKFWIVASANSSKFNLLWENVNKYPVPVLIHNFLTQYKIS